MNDFRNTADVVAGPPQFQLFYMGADTPRTIIEQMAGSERERIAPFDGADLSKKVDSAYERIAFPGRVIFYVADKREPEKLLATLQAVFSWGTPKSLDNVLAGADIAHGNPNTATFYSIVSHSGGKAGNFLLNSAVADIQNTKPEISNFVTLSPVYKFRSFLANLPEEPIRDLSLQSSFPVLRAEIGQAIKNESLWNELLSDPLTAMDLTSLCAHHLLTVKVGEDGKIRSSCDAAGFHLPRGARLESVNSLGNSTPFGQDHSIRFTANYGYSTSPEVTAANQADYKRGVPGRSIKIQNMVGRSLPMPELAQLSL